MTVPARPDPAAVWSALAEVPDPELPPVSIVDLGVVGAVEVDGRRVRVDLLPTFIGCPAIDLMREAVAARLAGLADEVDVVVSFTEPWTSERITEQGRRRLRDAGIAPPAPARGARGPVFAEIPVRAGRAGGTEALAPTAGPCPYCGSAETVLESAFGPTACRLVCYCNACRQPFEQFKTV